MTNQFSSFCVDDLGVAPSEKSLPYLYGIVDWVRSSLLSLAKSASRRIILWPCLRDLVLRKYYGAKPRREVGSRLLYKREPCRIFAIHLWQISSFSSSSWFGSSTMQAQINLAFIHDETSKISMGFSSPAPTSVKINSVIDYSKAAKKPQIFAALSGKPT